MNVLSLFDGISCGQLALQRAGIKVDKYFASEIDESAIIVTKHHFPDTIHLGSVVDVKASDLPEIDLLIGGSPCQGFSFAGKRANLEDPRSKLFYEFLRLYHETKPKYFLLENVRMNKQSEDVITELLGCSPVKINSRDFSAQNRLRLYWTNIPIAPWEDKGIVLQDILQDDLKDIDYHVTKTSQGHVENGTGFRSRHTLLTDISKSPTVVAKEERYIIHNVVLADDFYGNNKTPNSQMRIRGNIKGLDQKANCLTASNSDNPAGQGCTNILLRNPDGTINYRKITILEMERLQTLPDGYTSMLKSKTKRVHAIGNGWTVDVAAHIFKGIVSND